MTLVPANDAGGALEQPADLASVVVPLATAMAAAPSPDAFTQPPAVANARQPRRSTVSRFEAMATLRPATPLLRDHFGGAKGPFRVEQVDLADGKVASLVSQADESEPIVVVSADDRVEWTKPRPAAGMVGPIGHVAIAPRADGGVVFFAWVGALRTVAARMWADDGNAFGDFEVYHPESCDGLSAGYAPKFGWIVACRTSAGVRAARLREDATSVGSPQGTTIGFQGSSESVAIVFDSPSSFIALQLGVVGGAGHAFAFRYDGGANPLWPAPIDLGRAAMPALPMTAQVMGGWVRVEIPGGDGAPPRAVAITAAGEVRSVGGANR
jgi:hypothetical protein